LTRGTAGARGLGRGGRALHGFGEPVLQAFRVRAAVGPELGFDPVQRLAVALRALAAVTKLGQALDGGLVPLQVELADGLATGSAGSPAGVCANATGQARQRHEGGHLTWTGDSTSDVVGHVALDREGVCRAHDEHKRWRNRSL
jgi:hypothetical protein